MIPADDGGSMAERCWRAGNKRLGERNWNAAIEFYRQAVKRVPNRLVFRQSLREAEQRKYGNNGTGAVAANLLLTAVRLTIANLRLQENWAALDETSKDRLQVNPWDMSV